MTTLLAVTAHPDDESFLFGGALARYAAEGHRCGLLCLTDGQAGRTGGLVSRAKLARTRRAELVSAAELLGFVDLFTPGLLDGGLDAYGEERGTRLVGERIANYAADVLLTFGPEGASGHADHKACWRWTTAAAGGRRVYAASFPPGFREILPGREPLRVTTEIDVGSLGDLKRRAFLEHKTQLDHLGLFDRMLALMGGKEYYHRVQPRWDGAQGVETSMLTAAC